MYSFTISEWVIDYLKWHYGSALSELSNIYKNIFKFLVNFFSLQLLLKTLFRPWRRMNEPYGKGLDLEAFFESFVVNSLMRVVGFVVRIIVITIGLIVITVSLIGALVLYVAWLIAPITLFSLLIASFSILIK